jgi:hypothetical protein
MIWVFCKGLNAEYPVQQTFNRPVLRREDQFWTSPMPAVSAVIADRRPVSGCIDSAHPAASPRLFAGPAQSLQPRKNVGPAHCAGTSKAAGDRTNFWRLAATLCRRRAVARLAARTIGRSSPSEGDHSGHPGAVESTPDLAGFRHALPKKPLVFLGRMERPASEDKAWSNAALTTRAAASTSSSPSCLNIRLIGPRSQLLDA